MAAEHVPPRKSVNLLTWGGNQTRALVKASRFEVLRIMLQAGRSLPPHAVPGAVMVQRLSGKVSFSAAGDTQPMAAGDWLHLDGGREHSVSAQQDSCLLVTILLESPE